MILRLRPRAGGTGRERPVNPAQGPLGEPFRPARRRHLPLVIGSDLASAVVVLLGDGLELGFQLLDLAGMGAELLVGGALADAG